MHNTLHTLLVVLAIVLGVAAMVMFITGLTDPATIPAPRNVPIPLHSITTSP